MADQGLRPGLTSFPWKGSRSLSSWGRPDGNGDDLARASTNLTENSGSLIALEGLCIYLSVLNADAINPLHLFSITRRVQSVR